LEGLDLGFYDFLVGEAVGGRVVVADYVGEGGYGEGWIGDSVLVFFAGEEGFADGEG